MLLSRLRRRDRRRGAVAVEFAFVAPLFVAITWGVVHVSRMYEAQNLLSLAAREGARFGAMDRSEFDTAGQTSNQKLVADVKNFLDAQGVDKSAVNVDVTFPGTNNQFDLDDPNNQLEMFEVRISVPYSSVSHASGTSGQNTTLVAKAVFRNAQATISN